jgi:hypothetical protein
MIPKPLHQIGLSDLQALIDGPVAESKTIEYKIEIPGKGDPVPFLAGVSSFANTSGGDLLIGVEEENGLPKALPGIEVENLDQELLRLEHLMATGLEPRLPRVDIRPVKVEGDRYVLVVRAPRSWVAPHRVKGNQKFYGRNSAGKYPLDVGELRTAFTLSETVAERIRNFRVDRIARIYGRETPVPLLDGGCVVLHVLPIGAFTERQSLDLSDYHSWSKTIGLMDISVPDSRRINLDGVATFAAGRSERSRMYTQLFRSGAVEAVAIIEQVREGLNLTALEKQLNDAVFRYANAIAGLGMEPPLYVFLSFLSVRGFQLYNPDPLSTEGAPVLGEDSILLPEVVIEQKESEPHRIMQPLFDMVWNAFGLRGPARPASGPQPPTAASRR